MTNYANEIYIWLKRSILLSYSREQLGSNTTDSVSCTRSECPDNTQHLDDGLPHCFWGPVMEPKPDILLP